MLLYHRVFAPDKDPQLLCVSPPKFREQMQWLKDNCTVLPLAEMALRAQHSDLPNDAVSVTFDDGYFDNLAFAKPILVDLGVPATVYVSSGFIDSEAGMWWDVVEAILLSESPREWNVTLPPTMERQREYLALCAKLKFASLSERHEIIRRLEESDGAAPHRDSHRGLTQSELLDLANGGLVEVGGHTVDHPALSGMPVDSQRAQIENDKAALEQVLGHPVRSFAYPFGTPTEVDALTEKLTREAGYEFACANVSGSLSGRVRPHHIPREIVRNWDVTMFAARMSSWLYG